MSGKDPRGVLRGKCSKCDCKNYEYVENSGKASCFYCDCPAPAHEKLDENLMDQITQPNPNENTIVISFTPRKNGGMTAGISTVPSHTDPPVPLIVVPHETDLVRSSEVIVLKPQEDLLHNILNTAQEEIKSDDIPMPNVLPDSVNEALARRHLEGKHRSVICRAVVHKLLDENKASNEHLKVAARKIKKKYSPMKRLTDPQHKALYQKLLRTRDRIRNGGQSKMSETSQTPSPLSSKEAREAMFEDWAAGKKSVTTMGAYLEATRVLRNKEANKTKSLNLLVDYPALTIPQLVLYLYIF
ncbi:Chloroplast envelope quinone oxidoreductase-like protein [Frankliniella fusca]|uniref:Chloroplast envelope quinone oxidoreductase-like protein n=1 Tax=Frankliniella fusca TaxID=407009 RepID=A0AAE1H5M1_9NEOP|nr:Chloroplast envelope quinone oxidoreductase-like protein [Frankliniella fusca]